MLPRFPKVTDCIHRTQIQIFNGSLILILLFNNTSVFPTSKCKLRLLKLERIKDFLLMEEEFIQNQEVHRPSVDQDEVYHSIYYFFAHFFFLMLMFLIIHQTERAKVDDIRGTPMGVGTLEEMIDDNHAIVSSAMGPEYYVTVMSFVNQDLLEPGCSVLLHHKV